MYRIYCQGQEFGIDYPTLEKAREVKARYAQDFPRLKYYIRKARAERISTLVSKGA